jgi:hypothetical protein
MLGWKIFGSGLSGLAAKAMTGDAVSGLAATGTTQATALELTNECSVVATVSANTGVILSSQLSPGDKQYIYQTGANTLNVYPPVGMKFPATATNLPTVLATGNAELFVCFTTGIVV